MASVRSVRCARFLGILGLCRRDAHAGIEYVNVTRKTLFDC